MELSEDERNELMKKESSRLLKTGHRVSYSPRKEKALKIYLDGGPAKDPGQDWGTERHPPPSFGSSGCCSRATRLRDSVWVSGPIVTWTSSSAVRLTCSHPPLWAPGTGSETLLCTIVYCTVKFKGKYESYSIQKKKKRIKYCIDKSSESKSSRDGYRDVRTVKLGWKGIHPVYLSLPSPFTSVSFTLLPVTALFLFLFSGIALIPIHPWPSCESVRSHLFFWSTALLEKSSLISTLLTFPFKHLTAHTTKNYLSSLPRPPLSWRGKPHSLSDKLRRHSFTRFDESKKKKKKKATIKNL